MKESFQQLDGTQPSRETFLAALANIEAILVRATYHTVMMSSSIRDLTMDTAVPYNTGQEVASLLEDCTCPPGYAGLSCQVIGVPQYNKLFQRVSWTTALVGLLRFWARIPEDLGAI